ncbi:MAG: N-formylglutamate deformylase [Pseudomonadota bacterium]
MSIVEVRKGDSPLVLGLPHTGTQIPENYAARLNENGLQKADTDWHVDRLYDGLVENVTTVRTTIHRYCIDVNRDPGGESLYPGQNTTELCPLTDFDGRAIYDSASEPDAEEIARRSQSYHRPYHSALETELYRVKDINGFAILYDCHSIRSKIPFLFKGTLPDFNIGTNNGQTCAPEIEEITLALCKAAPDYSTIVNGRFKGGWTTRQYGRPDEGFHAIQMELAQSTYLGDEAPPWSYDAEKAGHLRAHLGAILTRLQSWIP